MAKGKRQGNSGMRKVQISAGSGSVPECLATIAAPFDVAGAKWPDDRTAHSGTAVSRVYLRQSFTAQSGTSSSHTGGILMVPHPAVGALNLNETVAGNSLLSDLAGGTGTSFNNIALPNKSALSGGASSTLRCVGMGIRVTYEGTELNRSGRIVAGMICNQGTPKVVATTGTAYSILSSALQSTANQVTFTTSTLRQAMTEVTEARVSDGVFEAHWVPNGVPSYMTEDASKDINTAVASGGVFRSAAGVDAAFTTNQGMATPPGSYGVERGQNLLALFIEGDTTSTAVSTSNLFDIDLVWHWEIVPDTPNSVTFTLTPSPYIPLELAQIINHMQTVPVAFYASAVSEYDDTVGVVSRDLIEDSRVNFGRGGGGQLLRQAASFISHPTVKNIARKLIRNIPYVGGIADMALSMIGPSRQQKLLTYPKRKAIKW